MLSLSTLSSLKGARLAVVVCLALAGQPLRQEAIERYTSYSDKPTSQALAWLVEMGYISRTAQGGYCLAQGNQLVLPSGSNSDESCPSRKVSDSVNNDSLIKDSLTKELTLTGVGNSPTQDQDQDQDKSETEVALARAGIVINDRTRPLLALSAEEVRAGVRRACSYRGIPSTGYIVSVLLSILATRKVCPQNMSHEDLAKDYSNWEA